MNQDRENFGSNIAAIMALAGSAIGLGNLWRFPYMVGQYGGAAFIILYILSSLFLALPIFLAESIIGRSTGSGTFGALEKLAPGRRLKWAGLVTVISPLIILSYYSVVGGWSVEYLGYSIVKGFGLDISGLFGQFISLPVMPLACHTVFLGLTALVVLAGVKSGIERFNKFSMPVLLVLIVIIALYSISLPGASGGIEYLLKPDFSKFTGDAVAGAMGQSFFSLSLGVGTVLTYSSYMRKKDNILITGLGTAGFDLMFALIAGLAIMPAVFAAGIQPDEGPGLIFQTLPYIFAKMGVESLVISRIISILFFLTIVIAALTSSISMFEVGVAFLTEEKKMSRSGSVLVILAGTWILGALCSLSFGPLSDVKIFGSTIFGLCDKLTSNYLMTFGGLLFVIVVGWIMGRDKVRDEFTNHGTLKANERIFNLIHFFIKFVAPVVILLIFLTNF